MNIELLSEHGYEEAALGFSLSYNTSVERAKVLMPKYAHGAAPGENKFLRIIWLWFDFFYFVIIAQFHIENQLVNEILCSNPCTFLAHVCAFFAHIIFFITKSIANTLTVSEHNTKSGTHPITPAKLNLITPVKSDRRLI